MLKQKRIQDLSALFWDLKRTNGNLDRLTICQQLESMPAPRFYISLSYAQRIIQDLNLGKPRATCYRMCQEHSELYRRWQASEEKTPEALQAILESPAPSFYLSAHRINRLLYKIYDKRK